MVVVLQAQSVNQKNLHIIFITFINLSNKAMKKRFMTLLLVVLCTIIGAQAINVRGTVVDQVNEPVIGATVKVLGTTMGAVTDFDGNFEIANVPDGATLKFTFMGMQAVEMAASEVMNVQLLMSQ